MKVSFQCCMPSCMCFAPFTVQAVAVTHENQGSFGARTHTHTHTHTCAFTLQRYLQMHLRWPQCFRVQAQGIIPSSLCAGPAHCTNSHCIPPGLISLPCLHECTGSGTACGTSAWALRILRCTAHSVAHPILSQG